MSDLAWFGREVFTRATEANVVAMKKAATLVEENAKKIMGTGPTSGKRLRRSGKGKRRKYHYPSAGGSPPAIDLGNLKSSITHKVKVEGNNVDGLVGSDTDYIRANADAGTDVEYGFYMEVGAPRANVAARPWLRPALRQSESDILRIFREANS